jgi:hypothetical protein
MIITLAQVKTRLGILDTSQDDYLRRLIEAAQSYTMTYCSNLFLSSKTNPRRATMTFTPTQIQDPSIDLSTIFQISQNILISGSEPNEGKIITISGFTTNFIDITSPDDLLISDAAVPNAIIAAVVWPADIKQAVEDMVVYDYQNPGSVEQVQDDIETEKTGNYSVKYKTKDVWQKYPSSITSILDVHRLLTFTPINYNDGIGSDNDW